MSQINIRNYDLGFLTAEHVTAQKFAKEDGEIVVIWCNHAGAIQEEIEDEIYVPGGIDRVVITRALVCDKCGAYQPEGQTEWQEAPYEGVHNV